MRDRGDRIDFSGMTVNERLFAAGLLDGFDAAARKRDRAKLVDLLKRVDLSQSDAEFSADTVLSNPSMYGY